MYKKAAAITAFALFTGFILYRVLSEGTPQPLGADAPVSSFSSARAKTLLADLARAPRPAGSPENARARQRILEILRGLSVEASVQEGLGVRSVVPGYFAGGHARNIVARIPGQNPGDALLIVGHYDSVTTGPGAGDDMSSCAAMLETIRAVSRTPGKFRNDVIFLFSDAEEGGLVGASLFAALHPWRARVKFVVNFEARGVSGPSSLFETSGHNLSMVRGYVKHAPFPAGTSFAGAVYDLMPNDTDFSVFKQAGYRGLNFAFVGGVQNYHTRLDTADAVDAATMQHHGDNMLTVVRYFANADLNQTTTDDAVYFPIWPGHIALYSQRASAWVSVLASVVTILFVAWTYHRRRTISGVLRSIWLLALVAGFIGIAVWLLLRFDAFVHPGRTFLAFGEPYNSNWYRSLFAFSTLLLFELLSVRFLTGYAMEVVAAGAALWWLVLLAVVQAFLPGASYAIAWPLIFALGAFFSYAGGRRYGESDPVRLRVRIGLLILALPVALLTVDTVRGILMGLSIRAGAVAAVILTFHLALLLPVFSLARSIFGGFFRGGLIAGAAVSLIGISATSRFSEREPVQTSIGYALHADTRESIWMSCDPQADAWTSKYFQGKESHQVLTQFFPALPNCIVHSGTPIAAPAPRIPLAHPEAVKIEERVTAKDRTVRLRIRSLRGAPILWITLRKKGLQGIRLDGGELTDPPTSKLAHRLIARTVDLQTFTGIRLQAMDRPIELEVRLDAGVLLEIHLADQDTNLAAMPGFIPRPSDSMPSASAFLWPPESTTVAKKYIF